MYCLEKMRLSSVFKLGRACIARIQSCQRYRHVSISKAISPFENCSEDVHKSFCALFQILLSSVGFCRYYYPRKVIKTADSNSKSSNNQLL